METAPPGKDVQTFCSVCRFVCGFFLVKTKAASFAAAAAAAATQPRRRCVQVSSGDVIGGHRWRSLSLAWTWPELELFAAAPHSKRQVATKIKRRPPPPPPRPRHPYNPYKKFPKYPGSQRADDPARFRPMIQSPTATPCKETRTRSVVVVVVVVVAAVVVVVVVVVDVVAACPKGNRYYRWLVCREPVVH